LPRFWKIAAILETTPKRTLAVGISQEYRVACSACRQDHETIFNRIVCFDVFSETNMISFKSAMLLAAFGFSVTGCTAMVSQASFYPSASLAAPDAVLKVPEGYTATDTMLALGELGAVRTVRLDNPASESAIIYSAGNGGFVDSEGTSRMAARLAEVTGADIILYDYPGRGGTTLPPPPLRRQWRLAPQ
jgi:hypothetical protein